VSRSEKTKRGGFVFGAVVGAAAGLLLAPRSGKETRAQLLGVGHGTGDQVDRIKGALEAGKEQAADQSEALRRKIQETRERLAREMAVDGDDADEGATPASGERSGQI
jgi:gas vesicle protein